MMETIVHDEDPMREVEVDGIEANHIDMDIGPLHVIYKPDDLNL